METITFRVRIVTFGMPTITFRVRSSTKPGGSGSDYNILGADGLKDRGRGLKAGAGRRSGGGISLNQVAPDRGEQMPTITFWVQKSEKHPFRSIE